MMAIELRNILLNSPAITTCSNPEETVMILSSQTQWGDADCIHIFSQEYNKNICVHLHRQDKVEFYHYKANDTPEFIHLHLTGNHYTPYFPTREDSMGETRQEAPLVSQQGHDNAMEDDEAWTAEPAGERHEPTVPPPRHDKAMTRYLTAEARPSHKLPPWTQGTEGTELFTHVQQLDEHPFVYKENLVYLLTSNIFLETEMLGALVERKYVSEDVLRSMPRTVGDICVSNVTNGKMFGVFIKEHMNSKPLRSDIRRCIRKLKHLLTELEIRSIGIVRDLAVL